jgi:hypothetical protein
MTPGGRFRVAQHQTRAAVGGSPRGLGGTETFNGNFSRDATLLFQVVDVQRECCGAVVSPGGYFHLGGEAEPREFSDAFFPHHRTGPCSGAPSLPPPIAADDEVFILNLVCRHASAIICDRDRTLGGIIVVGFRNTYIDPGRTSSQQFATSSAMAVSRRLYI